MKLVNRRNFAKLAGGVALITPVVAAGFHPAAVVGAQAPQQPQTPAAAPAESKPKYGMTKEQEERVKQSIARREQQNAALRSRMLPYSLEAAFVFRVKTAEVKKARSQEVKTK